jgi:hypothetical protein
MSAEAIRNVTEAMRLRLEAAITASGATGTVYVGPLDSPDAAGASLILFLYRLVPNAALRNREHRVAAAKPPPVVDVYRDSLPLDLYYLVTVGTRQGVAEEPLLILLGYAIRELQTNPNLVGSHVFQQSINESIHVSLEPLTTEEISRVWALFPTANYRTSVAYLATPVWIDPAQPSVPAKPVIQDTLLAGHHA